LAKIDIPTSYPAPNTAERDRLWQREAEHYKRLEARRNRELVEAQMREARAEREAERERLAALEAQALQQYTVAYPAWRAYPGRAPGALPDAIRPPGVPEVGAITRLAFRKCAKRELAAGRATLAMCFLCGGLAASPALAQETYRCTSPTARSPTSSRHARCSRGAQGGREPGQLHDRPRQARRPVEEG
jgi:hypothetical protein